MNLLLDNIVYQLQDAGGISTYWYELTRRLLRQEHVHLSFIESPHAVSRNIFRNKLSIPSIAILKRLGLPVLERFSRLNVGTLPDTVFHSSYFRVPVRNRRLKEVCTIHDFIHDLYYRGPRTWLHNYAKRRAINESDAIITVSENTRNDLLKFYPQIDPGRVVTIYNGVSDQFRVLRDQASAPQAPYLLYVGSREHYKNFPFAVKLARSAKDLHLYIVGPALTGVEQRLLNRQLPGRFKVFTAIDTATLNLLYNQAFCLIYPSFYEGFGLPVAEAMRAGCPFIALRNSSLPEVAGDAGVLLPESDVDAGIAAIEQINCNREASVKRGLAQSAKFSWDQCYKQTYELYKKL